MGNMKVTLLKLYQTSYISHDRNQTSRVPKIPGIFQRSIHLVPFDLALLSRQVITVIGQQRSCFIGPRKIHSRSRAARQREKEVRTVESGKKKHRQLKEGSGKGRKGCEGGKQKGERGGGGGEEEKREVAFTAAWTGVRDAREPFTCRRHTFFPFSFFFFFFFFLSRRLLPPQNEDEPEKGQRLARDPLKNYHAERNARIMPAYRLPLFFKLARRHADVPSSRKLSLGFRGHPRFMSVGERVWKRSPLVSGFVRFFVFFHRAPRTPVSVTERDTSKSTALNPWYVNYYVLRLRWLFINILTIFSDWFQAT